MLRNPVCSRRWLDTVRAAVLPCLLLLGTALVAAHGRAEEGPANAATLIAEQQTHLGQMPGVIVLKQPARLEGDVTLGVGQDLQIAAPLSVGKATIHLQGRNTIHCSAGIAVDNGTDLFVSDGAADISVDDCNVTVKGRAGGYLLTATHSERVSASNNQLVNMALFNTHNLGGETSQTVDVDLVGNSSIFTHDAGPIGVYLLYVLRGTVSNNHFAGTGHGIEWWGGDGNLGWHGADAVMGAGDLSITGNQCYAAGGACVWGSMGFNVTVSGNSADKCSDVCFDSEGGVRNLFTGNTAQACGNGCYSVQMESTDVVFSGNFAYADAKGPALALFLIKHRNGNPARHANLTVTGNTMSCPNLCTAFYSEGEGGLDLSRNTVVNGVIRFTNYTDSVRIAGNSLRYSVPFGDAALAGPALANGHISFIEDNTLVYEANQPAKAACIAQSWSDDNSSDEMHITGNTCVGFGIGIATETAGHNAGAPRAYWFVQHNTFSRIPDAQRFAHRKTSGNEVYIEGN